MMENGDPGGVKGSEGGWETRSKEGRKNKGKRRRENRRESERERRRDRQRQPFPPGSYDHTDL